MESRKRVLEDLIVCQGPISSVRERLAVFPWNLETELVTLDTPHLVSVLRRFLDGELSAADVEEWADALEGRDDVRFGGEDIADLLLWLSTSEINEPITPALAMKLIARYDPPSNTPLQTDGPSGRC